MSRRTCINKIDYHYCRNIDAGSQWTGPMFSMIKELLYLLEVVMVQVYVCMCAKPKVKQKFIPARN